ncbi:MAG: 50S ribosomal protein L24 [Deltaproteobacteria bacterium]|nr:50S ribosomal protein L24 [Deltaproteobacteria bacterium]
MARKLAKKGINKHDFTTLLRTGDTVMVISGGNSKSREIKGQTGKILRFNTKRCRVFIEGVNMIKRHKRARSAQEVGGIIEKEGSVHISNVMYFSDELKRPLRLRQKLLDNGKKVRGFTHPETKKFEQIDAA